MGKDISKNIPDKDLYPEYRTISYNPITRSTTLFLKWMKGFSRTHQSSKYRMSLLNMDPIVMDTSYYI